MQPHKIFPHLAKGSKYPPRKPGTLRIYSMRFCPFAQRVLMVANIEHIPHEIINIDVSNKPEWYLDKNPIGAVPVLEIDGGILSESLIISEYLQSYNAKKIMDPIKKAKDAILLQKFDSTVGSILPKLLFSTTLDEKTVQEQLKELTATLKIFEDELVRRNTLYFNGQTPGWLDIMMFPFVQRLSIIRLLYPKIEYDFSKAKQILLKWETWRLAMKLYFDKMNKGKILFDKEKQIKYIKIRRAGEEIIYDF